MKKEKKNVTVTDVAIVCSIIGIIAGLVFLFISDSSKPASTALLCSCSANLALSIKAKKNK